MKEDEIGWSCGKQGQKGCNYDLGGEKLKEGGGLE
jgi:hypothetical protein